MPKCDHPPAFLLYVDEFTSDGVVEAMTTKEVGAYFLLLCKAWRENPPGSIPDDDRVLARWARLTPDEWTECRTGVLAAFTLGTDSRWHQKRMRAEYNKLVKRSRDRSRSAKIAADARWHGDGCVTHAERNADAVRDHLSLTSDLEIPESLRTEEFIAIWTEWIAFRKKRRWSVDQSTCLSRQLKSLQGLPTQAAVECVDLSLRSGWQGIFPEKFKNGTTQQRAASATRVGPGQRYKPQEA